MNRHLATVVALAVALVATAYVLIAMAQNPDHPAVGAAELLVGTLLSFAAFVAGLALYVAARLGFPRLLRRWRRWRSVRRSIRHRARRRAQLMRQRRRPMQHRHAARIGGVQ